MSSTAMRIVQGKQNSFHDWWVDLESFHSVGSCVEFQLAEPDGRLLSSAARADFDLTCVVSNVRTAIVADWSGLRIQSLESLEPDPTELRLELQQDGMIALHGNQMRFEYFESGLKASVNHSRTKDDERAALSDTEVLNNELLTSLFPPSRFSEVKNVENLGDSAWLFTAIDRESVRIFRKPIINIFRVTASCDHYAQSAGQYDSRTYFVQLQR